MPGNTAEDITQLEDDLAKGNLLGEDAEAAQKLIDEAKAEQDAEDSKKAEEEAEAARAKMTDDEKAEADKKAAEEKAETEAAAEAEAKKEQEEEAKAAYDKLSDEEKAEADKKDAEEKEAAEQAERDEKTKGIKVPKFRFDAATARAKKAEIERDEALLKLDAATKANDTGDEKSAAEKHDEALATVDTKIAEAMKDGNSEEVSKLMAESRSLERGYQSDVSATNLKDSSDATRAQVDESTLVNKILDQLESEYPMFDANHADFNEEANTDVLRMQKGLIASGESAASALVEAVNMVLPKYGFTENTSEDDGKSDAEKAAIKKAADEKAAAEKKKTVEKNIKDANQQAPNMDDAGDDSDSNGMKKELPDINDLTDEEYDALPEAKRKEMRGDNF